LRADYTYHATTLDWGDLGYNIVIDKWGNIYEGRHGRGQGLSREAFSPGVVAGHALDHNYGSVGIALLGTFTPRREQRLSAGHRQVEPRSEQPRRPPRLQLDDLPGRLRVRPSAVDPGRSGRQAAGRFPGAPFAR
jgi:hypothetical protein